MQRQLTIDFVRFRRKAYLEAVIIPRFERKSPDGTIRLARTTGVKHLLRVIESHSGDGGPCRLKLKTVSHEMGVSERTVERSIDDASEIGLLKFKPSFDPHKASTFAIEWCRVLELLINNPKTIGLVDQSAKTTPDNLTATPDNLTATPDNLTLTLDNLTVQLRLDTSSSRVRALNHSSSVMGTNTEPSCANDGFEKESKTGFGGWPFPIREEDLQKIHRVEELWVHALAKGWTHECDRLRFFKLARYVRREFDEGKVASPGGKFTSLLRDCKKHGTWLGSQADEEAAMRALKKIDSISHATHQTESGDD